MGIGVISASELKGQGRGPGSWSGEFELGSARNGAASGMVLVTEECAVGVRKVSALVGGQVTSHAPMKVSNCGCVPAVAVAGEGLVSWAIRDAPLRWVRLIVRHCTPWSDFGRSEGHPGGPPLQGEVVATRRHGSVPGLTSAFFYEFTSIIMEAQA